MKGIDTVQKVEYILGSVLKIVSLPCKKTIRVMALNILLVLCGYLLGSIPSAVWIGKKFYGVDVRQYGSKNAGATNTLRVLGRRAALPVFIMDFFKGFASVKLSLLASYPADSHELFFLKIALIVAAVAGHIFPLFAGFKGGKGVATVAGAIFAMSTLPVLLSIATFFVVLMISHYVSLSSMTAALAFPLYLIFVFHESRSLVIFGFVVTIALFITHRKNIRRLINGTESRTYLFKKKK